MPELDGSGTTSSKCSIVFDFRRGAHQPCRLWREPTVTAYSNLRAKWPVILTRSPNPEQQQHLFAATTFRQELCLFYRRRRRIFDLYRQPDRRNLCSRRRLVLYYRWTFGWSWRLACWWSFKSPKFKMNNETLNHWDIVLRMEKKLLVIRI